MRARFTRAGRFWVGLGVACAVVVPVGTASAVELEKATRTSGSNWSFSSVEKCFMERINNRRASNGKGRLSWDKQLGYVARRHAQRIAGARTIAHDYNMGEEVTRWNRLGQNTGGGRSCKSLSRSFWNSSMHRSNILGTWRHVGVGVASSGGRLYVQQIFESRRDPGNIYSYP